MAPAKELSRIYALLRSEKSKDRQDGYQAVRDAFRDDASLEPSDEDDGGRKWLAVFQTLFGAVLKEKAAYVKKGVTNAAPVTIRRLADAASVVRWLAERTVTQLRRSVLRALIDHLFQTMVYRGELLEPVALDYSKSLRTLLSHQPHLDQLDDQRWMSLLHFSFSVLFCDRLAIDGNFEEEEEANLGDSSAMNVHEASEHSSDDSGTPRKRRRRDTPPSPVTRERFRALRSARQSLSLEQIELAGVIRILLSGSSAPYISSESTQVPVYILRRFKRFYTTYPADSSAHYDMVAALNSILSNLSLNAMREVSVLGHDIWAPLMESWNIRHKTLKERLVVAFWQLLPFVTHESAGITTLSERAAALDNIRRLCRLLDAEADVVGRGGLEPLSLDHLRLQLSSPSEQPLPFQLVSIRSGNVFGEQQALTWAAMELYSDCLSKVSEPMLHPFECNFDILISN
jgi:ataxia telangiectasia mutated family protein